MSTAFATAIATRWDDAGLTTSVDVLNWGQTTDESNTVPRAVYQFTKPRPSLSRGSKVYMSVVTFQTWDRTMDAVSGYNDSIEAAFHNGHAAATNPLAISGANVQHCIVMDSTAMEEETDMYQGVIMFEVQWSETNSVPS